MHNFTLQYVQRQREKTKRKEKNKEKREREKRKAKRKAKRKEKDKEKEKENLQNMCCSFLLTQNTLIKLFFMVQWRKTGNI